tara:strand:- start:5633 stop:6925 length:1293 start_codon:yes stop_codon:yes gene_type:complete
MNSLRIEPIAKVNGLINLPGSKSLSNRALLLAALADGVTEIRNLLDSDDIRHMLNALTKLGVDFILSEDKTVCKVTGNGGAFENDESLELFLGNAGTAMRPLCAALCLGKGEYTLTGEPRMEERPIDALIDALREAGCEVECLKNEGYPPVKISASGMRGGTLNIDGSISSQFLTALLMAAPMAQEDSEITIIGELVSKPYILITLDIMEKFGVKVEHDDFTVFRIKGGQTYQSLGVFMVEGDASSASYFMAAAAIKGGEVKVTGIGKSSVQGDVQFANVLSDMGAEVEWGDDYISVKPGKLGLVGVDQDMNHIPDAAMTIATTALFAKGKTAIRNIYNWRVKETDRLFAMATELRKLGVEVVEGEDFIEITPIPVSELKLAEIDTYDDHRIAMCFSLVALSETAVIINDPGCTAKTFPDYFERFDSICS